MLYRIHERLLVNATQGVFIDGGEGVVHNLECIGADKRAVLLSIGVVSPVFAAPFSEMFPAWKIRTERLEEAHIEPIGFLEMEPEAICDAVEAATDPPIKWKPALVAEWQEDVKARLGIGKVAKPRR